VVVRDIPPFATFSEGEWTGYSVQLWGDVAQRLDLKTRWAGGRHVLPAGEVVRPGRSLTQAAPGLFL